MPYKKLFSFRKIVFFLERRKSVYQANTKHFFFGQKFNSFKRAQKKNLHLRLKSSLSKLNQQSS